MHLFVTSVIGSVTTLLVLAAGNALAQGGPDRCGNEVRVQEGDTLSSIAHRCNVTEAKVLDLNPGIQGSKDLQTGMTLTLAPPPAGQVTDRARAAAQSLVDRLKSYAKDAGQSLESAAETVTSSVEDFVKRNPDLHQRVSKLGQRLSIPGMEKVEAQVSLSVRKGPPGTAVTLSAIGLPPNQSVEIAGGVPDGHYDILQTTRTSADGTLQITVLVPAGADPQKDFIFVVANPEQNLAARSATFDVADTSATAAPQ
jgi:hypothetical protein